jgi:hypothetical protein
MSTALQAFVLFATLELLIWLPPLWGYRAVTARSMMVFLAVSTAWLFITSPTFLVGLLVCLAVFRLVNLGRVVYGRVNTNYLQGVSWRTAWWFAVMEAITLGLWWGLHALSITQALFWDIVLFAQLVISVALFVTTLRHLKTTRPPRDIASLSTKQLPALTVAVPARNETDDLEACLESLVANDYPKLEILVYDDCSQNTRTPEIIRSFALD